MNGRNLVQISEATNRVNGLPPLTTQQMEPVAMADDTLFPEPALVKRCTKCGDEKLSSQFAIDHGRIGARCKSCRSKESMEWQRANRDRYRARLRRWYDANPEKRKEYGKGSYKRMSDSAKAKKSARAKVAHLKRKYGITPEEWSRLYEAQGGLCALCRVPGRVGKHGKLGVDHDHETGRVRGLLCAACNVALGVLGDTHQKMLRVMDYLREPEMP